MFSVARRSAGILFHALGAAMCVCVCVQVPRRSAQEPLELHVVAVDHFPVGRLRRHRSKHVLRPRHRRLHRSLSESTQPSIVRGTVNEYQLSD